MELTKEQIEYLFQFVQKKRVRYYDVQLELVDHLASAIEDKIKANPSLTFESALSNIYSEFPVTGFHQFVQAKSKGLRVYWRRKFWTFLRVHFQLPRILLTTLLFTLFYCSSFIQIEVLGKSINGLPTTLGITMIVLIIALFSLGIKQFGSKLLTIEMFQAELSLYLLIPWQVVLQFYIFGNHDPIIFEFSIRFLVSICLCLYAAISCLAVIGLYSDFKDWIDIELNEKYPEIIKMIPAKR